jgi:GxxExxY protein
MTVNDRQSLDVLAEIAIRAAYEVANTLGCGFIEKVYERALARELMLRGIAVETQAPIIVRYKGKSVGAYRADILIGGRLIIELKCADQFANEHLAQTLNYLKATGFRLALMINFQRPKVEWRRVIHNF